MSIENHGDNAEETKRMKEECDRLTEELENSYTEEQIEIINSIESLINAIENSKNKTNDTKKAQGIKFPSTKAYYLNDIQKYPKAYAKWSKEEENSLAEEFRQGKSIPELSVKFERNSMFS